MTPPRFPPAPWHLTGTAYVSFWCVPGKALPDWPLPAGVRPLRLGRHRMLVLFWVDYRPGGVLAYRELLLALAVRRRAGVAATAVAAWVDDARSLAGGRALWGIPKEPGALTFAGDGPRGTRTGLVTPAGEAVEGRHRDLVRLPGRLSVPGRLLQRRPAGPCRVPLRLTGGVTWGRSRLAARPGGPLAPLAGHRPWLSLALRDFRLTVGPGR